MPNLADVRAIATGATHGLALNGQGEVFFWGTFSELTGKPLATRTPFKLPLSRVDRIASGAQLGCAWARGKAQCFGPDLYWFDEPSPGGPFSGVTFPGADDLKAVAVGQAFFCGADPKGAVHCWGEADSIGSDDGEGRRAVRDARIPDLTGVVGLASRWHTCAVGADGRVTCWGRNGFSQLGDGTNARRSRPVSVATLTGAAAVAVGETSTCARTRDGRVLCWGENGYGQLGDGTTASKAQPTEVRFCAKTAEPIFFEPPAGAPLVAALQRTSCMGSCPVYSVRVYADGTAIYHGDSDVRVRGGRRVQLSAAKLEAVRGAFRRADFLRAPCVCGSASTDSPTARLYFADRGKARLLSHYHGCEAPPPSWSALEDEVDRILDTGRWVGSPLLQPSGSDSTIDIEANEGPLQMPGVKDDAR